MIPIPASLKHAYTPDDPPPFFFCLFGHLIVASTSLFQGLFDRLGGTDTTANTITTPASSSSKEKQGQGEEGQEQEQGGLPM